MASPRKCSVRSSLAPPSFRGAVGLGCLSNRAASVEVGSQFALNEAAQPVGDAAILSSGLLFDVFQHVGAKRNRGRGLPGGPAIV